jgi:fatty acid amide hydrolase
MRSTRSAILAKMAAERVSFLICPVHATPALPHGLSKDFTLAGSPSMLWNVMQFPAGAVPVTRVRPDETTRENPRDALEKRAAEVDQQSEGLPVGVQVVAQPWEDEVVLAAMMAIEDGVSDKPGFPRTPVPMGPQAAPNPGA